MCQASEPIQRYFVISQHQHRQVGLPSDTSGTPSVPSVPRDTSSPSTGGEDPLEDVLSPLTSQLFQECEKST